MWTVLITSFPPVPRIIHHRYLTFWLLPSYQYPEACCITTVATSDPVYSSPTIATNTNAELLQAMKLAESYYEVTKDKTTLRANNQGWATPDQEVNKRKLVLLIRCMREVKRDFRNYKEASLRVSHTFMVRL